MANINDYIPLILGILVNIPAIVSLYFKWKESDNNDRKADADLVMQYQEIAEREAIKAIERDKRIEELERKVLIIAELERSVERLSNELAEEKKARMDAEKRALLYEDWSLRLVLQMNKAEIIPVPLHPRTNE